MSPESAPGPIHYTRWRSFLEVLVLPADLGDHPLDHALSLDQILLERPGELLDPALDPERVASTADRFLEHQLQRASTSQVPRALALAVLMLRQSSRYVRRDPRVQGSVSAAHHVEIPSRHDEVFHGSLQGGNRLILLFCADADENSAESLLHRPRRSCLHVASHLRDEPR